MTKQTPFPTTWKESLNNLKISTSLKGWLTTRLVQYAFHVGVLLYLGSPWRGWPRDLVLVQYAFCVEGCFCIWVVLEGLTARLVGAFVFEGLTARLSSCPVCLSCRDDRYFLIQAIDVSVLTECTGLGWLCQATGKIFLSGLWDKYFWSACNEWRMWDCLLIAKPVAISHLGIHYDCC